MGAPTKQSSALFHLATCTPTIPGTEEKPAQMGVHRQPSEAQLRPKMRWQGARRVRAWHSDSGE